MNDRLEDYVDVPERIDAFFRKFPQGSLQPNKPWELRTVGDRLFIVYEAAAYREPDDRRPGIGSAWEPFPGPTAFTRDSELMNAETAAWGRAIVAVGRSASRKIATRQDVENRQAANGQPPEPEPAPKPKPKSSTLGASDAQRKKIQVLIAEKQITRTELAGILHGHQVALKTGWMDELSKGAGGSASMVIDELAKRPTPPPQLEEPTPDAV